MTPNNEGHFCSHCSKTVIDFTQLTDEQVAAVFKITVAGSAGVLLLRNWIVICLHRGQHTTVLLFQL